MPAFDTNAPRGAIDVMGLKDVNIPYIFEEGHKLSAEEARFMNVRLAGIMSNAYGGDLRREVGKIDTARAEAHKRGEYNGPMWTTENGKPDGKPLRHPKPAPATIEDLREAEGGPWNHQARLDAKFANYKVGGQNVRVAVEKDPLAAIARDIAIREAKEFLVKKNQSVKKWIDTKVTDEAGNETKESKFSTLVTYRLGKDKERIYALAREQVNSRQNAVEDELPEGLAFEVEDAEEAAEAA